MNPPPIFFQVNEENRFPQFDQLEFKDPSTVPYKAIFCWDIPLHRPYVRQVPPIQVPEIADIAIDPTNYGD